MIKAIAYQVLRLMPDWTPFNYAFTQVRHFLRFRSFLRPYSPRTFNDFVFRAKLSKDAGSPLRRLVTDKYELKRFVAERLGPGFTPETFAVLETADEIGAYEFPIPSVIKPTHTSGCVVFADRGQPDACQRADIIRWLKISHFVKGRERNYKNLTPRVIVERSLKDGSVVPCDLKVFCFHGCPHMIQVDYGRFSDHMRALYDMGGKRLPVRLNYPAAETGFPFTGLLGDVHRVASVLSDGFEFVRVDLYAVRQRIYVGELTFFPGNCLEEFDPPQFGHELGGLFAATAAGP